MFTFQVVHGTVVLYEARGELGQAYNEMVAWLNATGRLGKAHIWTLDLIRAADTPESAIGYIENSRETIRCIRP